MCTDQHTSTSAAQTPTTLLRRSLEGLSLRTLPSVTLRVETADSAVDAQEELRAEIDARDLQARITDHIYSNYQDT